MTSVRPQVLLGPMPQLLADIIARALEDAPVELLQQGARADALRRPGPDETPPAVVVAGDREASHEFERVVLRSRPEATILRVRDNGRTLESRALLPQLTELGELTVRLIEQAITDAPSWEKRLAG